MELKKGKYLVFALSTNNEPIDDTFVITTKMSSQDFATLVKNKHKDLLSIISVWRPETNEYCFYKNKYVVKFWDRNFRLKNRIITLDEDGTFRDIQDKLYAKEPDGNKIYSIKIKNTIHEFSPAYNQEELGYI